MVQKDGDLSLNLERSILKTPLLRNLKLQVSVALQENIPIWHYNQFFEVNKWFVS